MGFLRFIQLFFNSVGAGNFLIKNYHTAFFQPSGILVDTMQLFVALHSHVGTVSRDLSLSIVFSRS